MSQNRTRIAILGATSHIAKGLISRLSQNAIFNLHLFARSPGEVRHFLDSSLKGKAGTIEILDDFGRLADYSFDAVINCIGVGTERKLQGDYAKYFTVTEHFDNMVLHYLCSNCPETLYITFSSGAVYGRCLSGPAHGETANCIHVNRVTPQDYYGIARLNAEAKHRAFKDLNIVDLRVFSYFSRFIEVTEGYFIADIMDCILNNKILETSEVNIVRDYVHPDDLYSLIIKCLNVGNINAAFDVSSTRPVEKNEILTYFSDRYGLKFVLFKSLHHVSPTGSKKIYCSELHNADRIGFAPRYSSMDTIMLEAEHILKSR